MTKYAGRFAGKVVVVTSAAQGIGQTVALRIAHEGGSLALVDRSPLVEEVRREAEAAGFAHEIRYAADTRARSGVRSARRGKVLGVTKAAGGISKS
jgi:dihydroxycyclohexadiene carboxylate dehydrogenase